MTSWLGLELLLQDCYHSSRSQIDSIDDIRTLTENGSLLKVLERKIRDIEELTGLPIFEENICETVLPENLETLRSELNQSASGLGHMPTRS